MANGIAFSFSDVVGVVKTPGETLGRLTAEKNWIPMFLLLSMLVGIVTYVSYPARMAKMAEDPRIAELLPDSAQKDYLSGDAPLKRIVVSFFSVLLLFISISLGAFFVFLFFGIGGADGLYGNFYALVVNASLIDVAFPTLLSSVSLISGVNVAGVAAPLVLLISPEPNSLWFFILSTINVFSIWYTVALALGVRVFAKMSIKKSMVISFLYFLFKALIGIAFSYIWVKIMEALTQ